MGEAASKFLKHVVTFTEINVEGTRKTAGGPNRGRTMLPSSETLSKLLGIAYDAAADPTLWDSFLEELAIGTGATSAGLLMHDYDNSSYKLSSSWWVDSESLRLYGEHYYALDVW